MTLGSQIAVLVNDNIRVCREVKRIACKSGSFLYEVLSNTPQYAFGLGADQVNPP